MTIPAAGDYVLLAHFLEGNRIADLEWGTSGAQYAVLRFAVRSPVASRAFGVSLINAAVTHSITYALTTTAALNTWQEYSLVVPPCTAGTWVTDNTLGIYLRFCIASGTTFQTATTGVWQAGNFLGTSAIGGNYRSTASNIDITEVGLHADPNMTGRAPPYQMPHYEDDFRDCLRYWYKAFALQGVVSAATTANRCAAVHPVPMRIAPALTLVGTTLRVYDGAAVPNITAVANVNTTTQHVEANITASGGGMTLGRPAMVLCDAVETNYIACSARF